MNILVTAIATLAIVSAAATADSLISSPSTKVPEPTSSTSEARIALVTSEDTAPTFTASDLSNLPVGNCYVKLLVDGHPTPPFSLYVDWDEVNAVPRRPEVAQKIRENSRMKYGVPADQIEEYIKKRAGFEEKPEPPPVPKLSKSKIPF